MTQETVARATPARHYVAVWLALLALTFSSFGLSYVHTGAWEVPIALIIAVAKSVLVLLFFMHLVEQKLINGFVIVAAAGLVGLLLALVAADVASRHTFPAAPLLEVTPPTPNPSPPPPGGTAGPPPTPLPESP
jgi:cytochrome c oxidase subunit 4